MSQQKNVSSGIKQFFIFTMEVLTDTEEIYAVLGFIHLFFCCWS